MAGICGTDLHVYNWDKWSSERVNPPVILGHEFVGEIVELGDNVSNLKKGQRVSAEVHISCGICRYCMSGKKHICKTQKIIGIDVNGCFADYLCVPIINVWPIHENIPDKYAAVFDPLGNAMHTVMAQPVAMKKVFITGAGAIGLFATLIAKVCGASKVIVSDPCNFKREIAEKIGADIVLNPDKENIKERVLEATNGWGPDVFLEMSGNPSALHTGLDLLSNGGQVSLLGIPAKEISLNLAETVIFKGTTIRGIAGRQVFENWYQCEDFLIKFGKLIEPILTHYLELEDIGTGFELMEEGKAAKVLIKIN